MDIRIRKAEEKDCPKLLELIRELAVYERAPDEVTVTPEEFKEAGFGKRPVWEAFVAEVNEQIQGFALYYIRYSTWKGCRLYLEDILVTEAMRHKGIGTKLFESVLMEAKGKGYNGITWQVLDWNQPAIDFYKKYHSQFEPGWLNATLTKEQINY
jgi:GNAT superfamily N-acetyltransferase